MLPKYFKLQTPFTDIRISYPSYSDMENQTLSHVLAIFDARKTAPLNKQRVTEMIASTHCLLTTTTALLQQQLCSTQQQELT